MPRTDNARRPLVRVAQLGALVSLTALLSCDSTTPSTEHTYHLQGAIVEVEAAGNSLQIALPVVVRAWMADSTALTDSVYTDADGRYVAALGPTLSTLIDSVRVEVNQFSCTGTRVSGLMQRRPVASSGDTLTLPDMSLNLPWGMAQLSNGGSSCAAIDMPEVRDFVTLSLWEDDINRPQARGRWRLSHLITAPDDDGYFDGVRTATGLELTLRSSERPGCELALTIPVGGYNGIILGTARLRPVACFAAFDMPVRFFDGAILGEVLPKLP